MEEDLRKAYGCLAGVAIGDAMGAPTTLMTPDEISERYGYVEDFIEPPPDHPIHAGLKAGQVTDDTELTILVAESIMMSNGVDLNNYVKLLVEWALKRKIFETSFAGPSTTRALQKILKGADPRDTGKLGTTNGGAMRISPIGILDRRKLDQAIMDTHSICLPTHGSNVAISAASAISCAIAEAFDESASLESIIEAAIYGARKGFKLGFKIPSASVDKRIELALKIVEGAESTEEAVKLLYDYIGMGIEANEAVPSVIGIVKASDGETMKAIKAAVNIGGDADTIASMVGALCGALNGIESFPENLVKRVQEVNNLNLREIAEKLLEIKR